MPDTGKRMDTVCQLGFIILLLLPGSASQSIVFPSNITQQTTICADHGVIDGVDRIKQFGQVDTGTSNSTKSLYFVFEIKNASDPSSMFGADCFIDIDNNGCGHSSIDPCYCASQDSSTSYTVVYDRFADKRKSEYKLQLRWLAGSINSVTPFDLPVVHGKADISVICTGGLSADECCPFQGKQRNPLKFCVSNLDSPELFIKIGGTDRATATTNCITYTVPANETESELVFLYREGSGCKRTGNLTCSLGGSGDDDDDTVIIIIIVVVVCTVVIITTVVVIIIYHKRLLCFKKYRKQFDTQPKHEPAKPEPGKPPTRLPPIDSSHTETKKETPKKKKSKKKVNSPRNNKVKNGDNKTEGKDSIDGQNQDQMSPKYENTLDDQGDHIPEGQKETNIDLEERKNGEKPRPLPKRKDN